MKFGVKKGERKTRVRMPPALCGLVHVGFVKKSGRPEDVLVECWAGVGKWMGNTRAEGMAVFG